AHDVVLELEARAPRQWLDVDDADPELPLGPRLLLVAPLAALRRPGDRLPVGDPHRLGLDVGAELACQLLHGDLEVRLTGALEEGLVRLVRALAHPRGGLLRAA